MTKDYRRELQGLLRKLFQFDSADLDFGIYRIMNYKRDEIEKFIEEDLIKAVDVEFEKYSATSKGEIEKELEEITKTISSTLGGDALLPSGDIKEMYRGSPIAKEFYKKKEDLKSSKMADQHKSEIFSHIYQFFSRYYDDGDFISQRRYSRLNKYAVPYNGEEVLLHWANKDQYYIKTIEYFKNYSFRIGDYKVNFRLLEAETNQNEVRIANRFFLLKERNSQTISYDTESRELTIFFEYRILTAEETIRYGKRDVQKAILEEALNKLVSKIHIEGLKASLQKVENEKTLFEKHLLRYTKRNTTDYFIHKDLKGFLSGELEFYIKNEVLMIDDIGRENDVDIREYISRIWIIKSISLMIIDFLAQIEEFQKKLWLKKKFVTDTSWCVTIDTILKIKADNIRKEILAEIANNSDQHDEWVQLMSIDEIQPNLESPGYCRPVKIEFLMANPTLLIDTRHFSIEFTEHILDAIGNVDEQTDCILFQSENFQALSLLQATYLGNLQCIYIDPPYNTSENTFVYKNLYKHSSWISMIHNRIEASLPMLAKGGVLEVAIDDTETSFLRILLDSLLGDSNRVATIAVEVNPAGQNLRPNTPALSHDYCHIYASEIDQMEMLLRELTEEELALYKGKDKNGAFLWDNLRRRGGNSRPTDRPGQWFPLYVDGKSKRVSLEAFDGSEEIWPIDPQGENRIWRFNPAGVQRNIDAGEISVIEKVGRLEIVKKTRMPEGKKPKTHWSDSKYSATSYGTKLLIDIMGEQKFSYPKSLYLVSDCLRYWCDDESCVLDYFAGSGTTGHAIFNLNRDDGGRRKAILVEMADYFDTVLLPRLKKVTFTPEWKNGKPKRLATLEETERSPRMFKVVRLESYEDTLNNIEYFDSGTVQRTLEDLEGYFLRYMLDFETRDSPCRLNVEKLNHPFDYTLKITRENEMVDKKIDLVETFNYLLGLHVKRIKTFQINGSYYKVIHGKKANDTATIIWRATDGLNLKDDKEFIETQILREFKANKVYVNSDCFVEGTIPIELEFKRLMGA